MARNLFASSHIFQDASEIGDTPSEMAKRMPRVIHINLLNHVARKGSRELAEPFKLLYTKGAKEVAIPHFGGYDVQLPNIKNMEPDFSNSLYSWCHALYTADKEGKTMQEVLGGTKELQEYAESNLGFKQFCDRYNLVAGDPKARKEYHSYFLGQLREIGMREAAIEEGLEIGMQQGRLEEKYAVAAELLRGGYADEFVANLTKLPPDDVRALRGRLHGAE